MAISKEIVNKKKKTNNPEPLHSVPENNPDHQSRPEDFHHPHPHPHIVLYSSFEEARNACSLVFLKPGEAHTEFYKSDGVYHCVVAIGNISPGAGHLFITDSGNQKSLDDSLSEMYDQIVLMEKQFTALNTNVDDLGQQIAQFEINLNDGLAEIREALQTLLTFEEEVDAKIDDISTNVAEQKEALENLNSSINNIAQTVAGMQDSINANTQAIDNLADRVDNIDTKIQSFDSSIAELHDLIDGFAPILDSSIPPLFRDDILTVNLCCYTNGGWIEIRDYYDEDRVSECTPKNEFKTYVAGDSVDLIAHTNVGYEFLGWVKDADTEHIIRNSSIHVEFTDNDINVKGKVINAPYDPEMVRHGYTALYEKLHTISLNIDVHVINGQGEPVYNDDSIDVYIDGVLCTQAPYYFKNNSNIILKPVARAGHVFDYMTVNYDGIKHYVDYRNAHCTEDLQVFANFNEHWSKVTVDAEPANHARIESTHGIGGSYIYGEEIDINGICDEGYEFYKWQPETGSDLTPAQLAHDIVSGTIYSSSIILKVNKDVNEYEITGIFRPTN